MSSFIFDQFKPRANSGRPGVLFPLLLRLAPDPEALILRLQITSGSTPQLDYNSQAASFNKAFFVRNFLKCHTFATATGLLDVLESRRFVDVGGGAGVFALAVRMIARDVHKNTDISLVDRSLAQLEFSATLSKEIGFAIADASYPCNLTSAATLPVACRLFSYWFCENSDVLSEDDTMSDLLRPAAAVIDYPEVVHDITHRFQSRARVRQWSGTLSIPPHIRRFIGQPNIDIHGAIIDNV